VPIYQQTLHMQGLAKQGSYGCLWEVLPGMEYLLSKIKDWNSFFEAYERVDKAQEPSQPRRRTRLNRNPRPTSPYNTLSISNYLRAE